MTLFSDEKLRRTWQRGDTSSPLRPTPSISGILPQLVFYLRLLHDLLNLGKIQMGEKVNYCVPTGNFGNILACWYAGQMGLPVGKLICASNSNNVLTDFLATGTYDRNRPFHTTMSPWDGHLLVSSNLERLLFALLGRGRPGGGRVKQLGRRDAIHRPRRSGQAPEDFTAASATRPPPAPSSPRSGRASRLSHRSPPRRWPMR